MKLGNDGKQEENKAEEVNRLGHDDHNQGTEDGVGGDADVVSLPSKCCNGG